MTTHVARWHMAGIYRRIAGCEQSDQCRLWSMDMENRLLVAIGRDLIEIAIPSLARIEAQFVLRLAEQQVISAFDVRCSKRLAVVPLDTLPQFEGQLGSVLAPRPTGGEIGHDRTHAVLRLVLLVHDKVVEDTHHRHDGGVGRLLDDGHARWTVLMVNLKHPALLLRESHIGCRHSKQQPARSYEGPKLRCHLSLSVARAN